MTGAQFCDRFEQRELAKETTWRSHATKKIYKAYLTRWIRPHWKKYQLAEVRTIQVESWLRGLPLAKSSCAKIRNLMSVLFNHACRYELFDRNPIYLVRQSAKRRTPPAILVPAEIKALIDGLALRHRTLVVLAASIGLQQSEIFGLKWGDIAKACANASDSRGRFNAVEKALYLHHAGALGFCKQALSRPKALLGPGGLAQIHTPAAQRAGIQKRFGWHTFRHTYSTLLRSVGTEFKLMQALLGHSSFRSTLDVYTQAVTPAKHAAQAAVMSLVFSPDKNGGTLDAGGKLRVDEKGHKKGAKHALFTPSMVTMKIA